MTCPIISSRLVWNTAPLMSAMFLVLVQSPVQARSMTWGDTRPATSRLPGDTPEWSEPVALLPEIDGDGRRYRVETVVSAEEQGAWLFVVDKTLSDDHIVVWAVHAPGPGEQVASFPVVDAPRSSVGDGSAVVMADGRVLFAYTRLDLDTDEETIEIVSRDPGGEWTHPTILVRERVGIQRLDMVRDDQGDLVLTFERDVEGVYEIPMIMFLEGLSDTWTDPVRITPEDQATGYLSLLSNEDGSAVYLGYSLYSAPDATPGMYLQRVDTLTLELEPPILIAGTAAALKRGALASHYFFPAGVDAFGDVTMLFQAGPTWPCGFNYYCSEIDLWAVRIEDGECSRPVRLIRDAPNAWFNDDYSVDVSASGRVLFTFLQPFPSETVALSAQYRPDTGRWSLRMINLDYGYPPRVVYRGEGDTAVAAMSTSESDGFQITSKLFDGNRWDTSFTSVPGNDLAYWNDYGVVDTGRSSFLWYVTSDYDRVMGSWLR